MCSRRICLSSLVFLLAGLTSMSAGSEKVVPQVLPATSRLTLQGDFAVRVVAGVDRFLLRELAASVKRRSRHWKRDGSSAAAYTRSVATNRKGFRQLLGVAAEPRTKTTMQLTGTVGRSALVASGNGYRIYTVRWRALDGLHGEGLLLRPLTKPRAHVVAIGDCQHQPEMLAGMKAGIGNSSQFARRLAESGCEVLIPVMIDRGHRLSVIADGRKRSNVTHRELLNRAAFQMGRHLTGYEIEKVRSAVSWFVQQRDDRPVGVIGYGEGGLLALYASAIDERISVAGVSGYFESRQRIWEEPMDRNIFGLLREFGDAEIASLIAPRRLVIEACQGPKLKIATRRESAPARLTGPDIGSVRSEFQRAKQLVAGLAKPPVELVVSGDGKGPFGQPRFLQSFLRALGLKIELPPAGHLPRVIHSTDPTARHARQFHEMATFSQRLVDRSPRVRARFLGKLETQKGPAAYQLSTQSLRKYFRDEIIGNYKRQLSKPRPRSRLKYDRPKFRGYEVLLDVMPDVQLYGILLVPKNISAAERRPVVVCQHGLEGTSEATISGDRTSYRDFAARLARRGFVTFSPQHLYRGGDRFRTLQRKANPLKRSLFSIMVAQHRQLLRWLSKLEFVDGKRIGFYGISYGGKSAMRIPAILDGYCLSVCSSDFSDWIWRTVSNGFASGYLAHSEYEIFEFNLGNTFNYAEMAALICPRPFMVERFHHHGPVADRIAAEYGKVQLLYENLGLSDRTAMTYFGNFRNTSPYTPRRSFDFLHRHLSWPKRK